jgi:hypothetical protein
VLRVADRYAPDDMNDGIGRARERAWHATISKQNG